MQTLVESRITEAGKPPCTALNLQCQLVYFKLEEVRRERYRMQRLLHPETLKGAPPKRRAYSSYIRIEALRQLGKDEEYYRKLIAQEAELKKELESLAEIHPLWPHWSRIKGLGLYLCGAFAAAAGDISITPTVSAFWKSMGLDVLPDGTVPRKIRGRKGTERRIPALPHVTTIGEQIRQSILRGRGKLYELYCAKKAYYTAKRPDKAAIWNHRAALRVVQKILYAVSWEVMRLADGLDAPRPYAFDILKHPDGHLITFEDLYDG